MALLFIVLFGVIVGHYNQIKPKPRNMLLCGPTGDWNACQNHRVWPSNGYGGKTIGEYPTPSNWKGMPCFPCTGCQIDASGEQLAAMSKPGEIQETYKAGQEIEVEWEVKAWHGGIYSWRFCLDADNPTEECFRKGILDIVGGAGKGPGGKWKDASQKSGIIKDRVKLPDGVTCDKCIISFRTDGELEKSTFVNCADVRIKGDPTTVATKPPTVQSSEISPPSMQNDGMSHSKNTKIIQIGQSII